MPSIYCASTAGNNARRSGVDQHFTTCWDCNRIRSLSNQPKVLAKRPIDEEAAADGVLFGNRPPETAIAAVRTVVT